MWTQRLMWIAWPAFLMAGVLEMLVFAMVDPQDLHWFGQPLALSRQGVYTLAFFVFWAITMATSALTTLSTRPDDISSMTSSRDFSDLMVAFGAKRRATVSLAEPASTAILTSGLLMSAQVLASSPFLSMAPNG